MRIALACLLLPTLLIGAVGCGESQPPVTIDTSTKPSVVAKPVENKVKTERR